MVEPVETDPVRLSFMNLLECHVLAGMRKLYDLKLPKVRTAVERVGEKMGRPHPLVTQAFLTDHRDLFIEEMGKIINVFLKSQEQMGFDFYNKFLERVETGPAGTIRFFPFVIGPNLKEPKTIEINPLVSFGKPVTLGLGYRQRLSHHASMPANPSGTLPKNMAARRNKSKRQFVGSGQSLSPPEDFVLYLDENLCNSRALLELLLRRGVRHERHLTHFPRGMPDHVWLPKVGENGWILLTADKRIRYNMLEKKALSECKVKEFVFASGNLSGEEMAAALDAAIYKMVRLAAKTDAPFVAAITRSGEVHLRWPSKE